MVDIEAPRKRHVDYRVDELLDMRRRDRETFPSERVQQAVIETSTSAEIAPYLDGTVLRGLAGTSLDAVRQHAAREEAAFWRSLDDLRRARTRRTAYQALAVAVGGAALVAVFGLVLLARALPIAAAVLVVAIAMAGGAVYAFRAEIGERMETVFGGGWPANWADIWQREDGGAVTAQLERWQAALSDGFLPYLREAMAGASSMPRFRRGAGSVPGLRQPFDARFHVATGTGERLARLLKDMDGGSVALAGARGTGKTNLIEAMLAGYYRDVSPGVAVILPAPVRYEPRDFVLQLYAMACEKVMDVCARLQRSGPRPRLQGLARRARSSLHHVRNLQTTTVQVGGVLRGMNLVGTRSHARQALTYPEIVEEFRGFLEFVSMVLSTEEEAAGVTVPVLIAIDELDRMGSAENARTFLNEVKGIFNVRGCRFVVSIADETLETFELAGTPLDVVVDRAFDEVVHVDYVDLDTVRRLLTRRVTPPFHDTHVALCYCLSGGIARDAVRAARTMAGIGHAAEAGDGLDAILGELVAHEMQTAVRWARNALLRSSAEPFVTDAIGRLDTWWDQVGTDRGRLRGMLARTAAERLPDGTPADLVEVWDRLLAVTCFLITLLDVFASEDAALAGLGDQERAGTLALLARSRRVLRRNDRLARSLLDRFRADWGLDRLTA